MVSNFEAVRLIKSVAPANLDAIFCDSETKTLYRLRVMAIAVTQEIERGDVLRETVLPVDLNGLGAPFELFDTPEFLGVIPTGADPRDPEFILPLPRDLKDGGHWHERLEESA